MNGLACTFVMVFSETKMAKLKRFWTKTIPRSWSISTRRNMACSWLEFSLETEKRVRKTPTLMFQRTFL